MMCKSIRNLQFPTPHRNISHHQGRASTAAPYVTQFKFKLCQSAQIKRARARSCHKEDLGEWNLRLPFLHTDERTPFLFLTLSNLAKVSSEWNKKKWVCNKLFHSFLFMSFNVPKLVVLLISQRLLLRGSPIFFNYATTIFSSDPKDIYAPSQALPAGAAPCNTN
jgi:hypothetical protein